MSVLLKATSIDQLYKAKITNVIEENMREKCSDICGFQIF